MKWRYLHNALVLLILLWFSEAKQRKKNLEKVLHEVIASLLMDENLDRRPRSNGTTDTKTSTSPPPNMSLYNYWLLPANLVSTVPTTRSTTESINYWLNRMPPARSVPSGIDKLRDQIRFQALVKKTNMEFLGFLSKLIEDKKTELNEEDKEIKEEYAELNRTREALFRAYNRELPDKKLEDLRRKLTEKEAQFRELMTMHRLRRFSRDLGVGTPWIRINYPGGVIRETLRRKKSRNEFYESGDTDGASSESSAVNNEADIRNGLETRSYGIHYKGTTKISPKASTMTLGEVLWKSLGKYLPFSGKNPNFAASIPLEVHYRVGRDVAHITIRVGNSEEATTQQFDGCKNI